MKKIVPKDAHLIPPEAKKVFRGIVYDVYQWSQKMFDGSTAEFEMLRRPDTTSVLIIHEGKILVVKLLQPSWGKPKYGFPGGRVDEGETTLDAIKRELLEETGLSFENWKLLHVKQMLEKIEWFIYTYVATNQTGKEVVQREGGEQIQIEYMDFEEVKNLSKTEPRLGRSELELYQSVDEIFNAPEFEGQEIEVSAENT